MVSENILLNNLNSEQKKAVIDTDGPNLIVAGAGSGKTEFLQQNLLILLIKKAQINFMCDLHQ